jgi:hypothetical protein
MKRCSTSLIPQERQTKTTGRYCLMPFRMVILKKRKVTDVVNQIYRQIRTLMLVVGMLNGMSTMEDSMEAPQKTQKKNHSLPSIYTKELKMRT